MGRLLDETAGSLSHLIDQADRFTPEQIHQLEKGQTTNHQYLGFYRRPIRKFFCVDRW